MPKRLTKSQHAAMLDLIAEVNRNDITTRTELMVGLAENELPEWFADWPLWSAGENTPGYMPDSPYRLFLTERAARGYCRELEREGGGRDYVSDYMPTTLREVLAR